MLKKLLNLFWKIVKNFQTGFMNRPKISYQQGYKQVINRFLSGIVDK